MAYNGDCKINGIPNPFFLDHEYTKKHAPIQEKFLTRFIQPHRRMNVCAPGPQLSSLTCGFRE